MGLKSIVLKPVDDPTKVLIWKQITTSKKDVLDLKPVDDPTKVLIWKQITTKEKNIIKWVYLLMTQQRY